MKILDELLNRYIDNELSTGELVQFQKQLESDENLLQKLKALQYVEQSAKRIEIYSAPNGITEKIMAKISLQLSERYKKNHFFRFIVFVFTVLILSISGFMVSSLVNSNFGLNIKNSFFTKLSSFSEKEIHLIEKFLANPNTLLIISSITLLLLLSLYFIIESNLFANQKSKSF
ncbi:hypothetical protein BMS3Abin04_00853 [bacterium BMS3Abin04]|nr:hypothetical protein BMS3Abin04_00853 [bacterium BMS3Abin04]